MSVIRAAREAASSARNILPGNARNAPLSLGFLKTIAESRGVSQIEFAAPIVSEGQLVRRDEGGFTVRIARSSESARGRYSLAHEIGHTFFHEHGGSAGGSALWVSDTTQDEEMFCDMFAAELLFPAEVAATVLRPICETSDAVALLGQLEQYGRKWGVSVEAILRRANDTVRLGGGLLAIVLRERPHRMTGRDVALRVVSVFPHPTFKWFIPVNRRAQSVGLRGALLLHRWWKEDRNICRSRRHGVASLRMQDGTVEIFENARMPLGTFPETIHVWHRPSARHSWRSRVIRAEIAYRFYGIGPSEWYVVAAAHLPG